MIFPQNKGCIWIIPWFCSMLRNIGPCCALFSQHFHTLKTGLQVLYILLIIKFKEFIYFVNLCIFLKFWILEKNIYVLVTKSHHFTEFRVNCDDGSCLGLHSKGDVLTSWLEPICICFCFYVHAIKSFFFSNSSIDQWYIEENTQITHIKKN